MNEFDFIERLRQHASSRKHSSRIITGIGDDGSVIRESPNHDLVVTTDLLIEGIDFYADATPARILGHKALAVSLSVHILSQYPVITWGTDEQKSRWLPGMLAGKEMGAFALTEPQAGSDASALINERRQQP